MILYEILREIHPEISNQIDKRAEQLDGTYLISKSEKRMDYVIDFFACYKTNTTYIPVSFNIEQHHLDEIESKTKYLTDDIAAVYSTSGTTGKSKFVTHSWSSIEWCVLESIKEWEYTEDDFVYCPELPNAVAPLMITIPSFLSGAKFIIEKWNPSTINKHAFTMIPMTPKMNDMLNGTEDFDGARTTMGSDFVEQQHVDKFKEQGGSDWWCSWSMTEVLMPGMTGKNMLIMNPHKNYDVKLNDKSELLVKGPGLMLGYLGEERTSGWFNTKDIWEKVDGGYRFISRGTKVVNHL
jgi:long-subunit acyl-CoA synthetase (AMP-forming)